MPENPLKDSSIVAKLCNSDKQNVDKVLMPIIYALEEQGINNYYTQVAALATAAVESRFACVEEAHWLSEKARMAYFNKSKYGKVDPDTGKRYYGRGIIQLTWKNNYRAYGEALGYDFINHPDKVMEPEIAAKILALYFKWRKVDEAAKALDWTKTRKLVNGGLNGYGTYMTYVNNMLVALKKAGCI